MITAIDSSVFYAIRKREPDAEAWMEALREAGSAGPLVVCEVVFAEVAPLHGSAGRLLEDLRRLNISYSAVQPEAAFLAGQIHLAYRRDGGQREHLLPDFLIGAHALVQADQLAAIDRGYLRLYFGQLQLLLP